jgi:hypothetical protein
MHDRSQYNAAPGAVDQQMDRPAGRTRSGGQRHGLGTPTNGGVIGNRQVEPEQVQDGADEALRLAQGQMDHGAQGQRRRDRQGGRVWLPAGRGAGFGPPRRDCLRGEPHSQAAALAQGGLLRRPVRQPATSAGEGDDGERH